jgi:hypothetical protein
MPASIESRTETRTLALSGSVQDEPAVPVQYSTLDRNFTPEEWFVTFVKHGSFPWRVERWQVRGRIMIRGNQPGKMKGRYGGHSPMGSGDRERLPWLAKIIDDNTPKDDAS